ncbi:MAG: hypothetical protein GX986_03805 [Firmicutes bacterium]|nr:hypothetical protein [Bacillota bacterium]
MCDAVISVTGVIVGREDIVHSVNSQLVEDDTRRVQAYGADLVERVGRVFTKTGARSRQNAYVLTGYPRQRSCPMEYLILLSG